MKKVYYTRIDGREVKARTSDRDYKYCLVYYGKVIAFSSSYDGIKAKYEKEGKDIWDLQIGNIKYSSKYGYTGRLDELEIADLYTKGVN